MVKKRKLNVRVVEIIGLVIAIISIWFSFYLSSPINLEVWHNISGEDPRLYIYAKNNDPIRSTGPIDIYRLEVNPYKPHIQLKDGLKPKEEKRIASLIIKINESKEVIISNDIWKQFKVPASLIYFITEDTSISYKVTCGNCRSDGIIKRIPETGGIASSIILDPKNNQITLKIPVYGWETKKLEDLYTAYPIYEK